jgi:hypothetical protein
MANKPMSTPMTIKNKKMRVKILNKKCNKTKNKICKGDNI